MSRLEILAAEALSSEQRRVYDAIMGGRRGTTQSLTDGLPGLAGPFNAMLYSPGIGLPLQAVGEALRFDNSLPGDLLEIAVCVVAARWKSRYEWFAHARFAREHGVSEPVLEAIRNRRQPVFDDERAATVHAFARGIVDDHGVDDATYRAAIAAIGERMVVDLTLLIGYYQLISTILNVFEVPLPDGVADPFAEIS